MKHFPRTMLLAIATAGTFLGLRVEALLAQETVETVSVSRVVEREVAGGQTFVGTVSPRRTSVVGSAVDGRVAELLVDEGDFVEKGQPLSRFQTDTLKIELAAANAELSLRRERLAELENGSRPEIIAQARAGMLSAKALMDYSKASLERMESLFDQGRVVTEREVQEAHSAAARDEQNYLRAKAAHDLAVRGPRKEQIAQAAAHVSVQREQVRLIEDRIAKHTILAPFSGYVSAEHIEVGEWGSQGDPIVEIIDLDEVEITAFVLANHAVQIRAGTPARVEVPALAGEVFTGVVKLVVPKADTRSRTFPVKILVKNRMNQGGPLLKAGMLARVALSIGQKRRMTLVPKDALVLGDDVAQVFVVDVTSKDSQHGTARAVNIELGVTDGILIQAIGSLKPGQRVVVRGNERLRNGQQIQITEELTPEAVTSP